jgi:hypothetical protein
MKTLEQKIKNREYMRKYSKLHPNHSKGWYEKHPDKKKEHDKNYTLRHNSEERICIICGQKFKVIRTNLKHLNESMVKKTCSEECRKIRCQNMNKKWHEENTEKVKECQKKRREKMKFEVLAHYSNGVPECACCGESHIEFLTIDHINGRGAEHRREIFKRYDNKRLGGYAFYSWLKKNNYPDGYRVLCFNCNFSLGHFGYCPHNKLEKTETHK